MEEQKLDIEQNIENQNEKTVKKENNNKEIDNKMEEKVENKNDDILGNIQLKEKEKLTEIEKK